MTESKSQRSHLIKESSLYTGEWVECVEITYQDELGKERTWESVHRLDRTDAVIIIPRLEPSEQYVLIKQFRPPIGTYVIEFPAGLMDSGEKPEQTALRELKEETGYVGKVTHTTPPLYTSPGMLSESCYFVSVTIDETLQANQSPQANNEPEEFIEVFVISPHEFPMFSANERAKGVAMDIKLYAFFNNIFR